MNLLLVNDATLELYSMKNEIPWSNYGIDVVLTAENVSQAKDVISANAVDILLCDIEMPGENGLSLISWIREQNLNIDCVLLTCHMDFAYAKEAISLGCLEYLVLPARYEDIGETINKTVERRKQNYHAKELAEYGQNWINQQKEQLNDQQKHRTVDETIEECAAFVQEHLSDEDLNVNDIGAHFYLSPIYLSRIFKQKKGIGLNQWITKQRMELAGQLLKDGKLTAMVVAEHCGYANYPYFSTVFKNYYGCTPSQYMQKGDD